ncbi:hypothetical protein [Flavobacterium sp.]|uniref:hypothetical protein n=1 Tax=Flavobacterium sp. TaxID=239 RepID=UPI0039E726AA
MTTKKAILSFLLIVLIFSLIIRVFGTNSDLAKNITREKIESIEPGMSYEKVISILGKPIKVRQSKTLTVMEYSRPVSFSKNYPMLWVNLDRNNKVDHVYAKRYIWFGCDDEGIYLREKENKSMDKEKFELCFN